VRTSADRNDPQLGHIAYTILQNLGVDTRVLKEVLLFWMNRCGGVQGSRSVIGRIEYARTKELKSEDTK
jgi:hypothetical protein